MSSKKRGVDTVEEGQVAVNDGIESKKNVKSEDGKVDTESGPPMERRKKRKMLDKERHRVEAESKEKKPVVVAMIEDDGGGATSSSGSDQPEFHISVFGDLASANAVKREEAAERLAVELMEVQKAFEKGGDKGAVTGGLKLEAEKDDGLDNCAPSVRYAIRRLIRGVSSSRECARQGFALGLTVLLSTNSKVRVESVLKLVDSSLEVTSSMKGQEARDCFLGRLFAHGALARSGRLKREFNSNRNTPLIKEFTSLLISLASKKRYLQEPAVSVLLDFVEMLPKEAVMNHILDAPGVREWFDGATDAGNPDALLLALIVREKIAVDSDIFGKLLPQPFSSSRLFSKEHLTSIANCLKESTFCQPRVHGIWPLLVNILLPDTVLQDTNASSSLNFAKKSKKSRRSSTSDEDIEGNLRCFCEVIFEGCLLASSHDRKHLAFDVMLLILPRLPASHVPIVLSLKFVQGLMDILSTKDSWLHKVAVHFLEELSVWVGSDDVRRAFVIVALQKHSNGRFDCTTRTKTVKDLIAGFTTESGCMRFIQKMTSMFFDDSPTMDENSEMGLVEEKEPADRSARRDNLKSWVVESLPGLLKHLTLDIEAKFRLQKEVMKFLAVQGLFSATLGTELTSFELQEKFTWPKTPISSALSKMCINQLQLLLSNAQKAEGSHALTNGLEINDLGYHFMRILGTLCNIPSVSLIRPLSAEDEKVFKKLKDMESRLSGEEKNHGLDAGANKLHALRYLLIQLLLQLLLQPGELSEAASELIICCQKAYSVNDIDSSGEDESEDGEAPDLMDKSEDGEAPESMDEPEDGESPELMDVLVDTLLSLLPQSSAPLRSAVEQVFRYFCKDVTDDGLLRMLRVIKKELKPPRHKDADDEDDDDDDLLDIEDEGKPDDVTDGGNLEVQSDDAGDVVDDSDEGTSDASDDDDNNEDPEDMDDEAMFRMDALLAKIFQERKGDTAHAQLVLFKLRILSLVEIYLHENPGSTRVLAAYSNLVQAFMNPSATEGSKQLAQRIWGILQKNIFKAKDYPKGADVQLSTLDALLEKSLRLASRPFRKKRSAKKPQAKQSFSRDRYRMISSLAQQSTHWILKIIDGRKFPEAELDKVFEIFKGVIESYFNSRKSQIKPAFLKEIFKRRPWVGQHLFGYLVEKCADSKSHYRRVGALDLVQETLKLMLAASTPDATKKMLKPHLSRLSHLVKQLVTHMPEKQPRRNEVKKFATKIFQTISTHKMAKSFLKTLDPDAQAACESQFGQAFLALKSAEN